MSALSDASSLDMGSWDERGSTLRARGLDDDGVPLRYLDLTEVPGRFVPAITPANHHLWRDPDTKAGGPDAMVTAYVTRTIVIVGLDRVGKRLESPGLHRLMYVRDMGDGSYRMRMHTFGPGSPECEHTGFQPRTQREWLAMKAGKSDRFPHECPRCGGPAFVGAVLVDCQRRCH